MREVPCPACGGARLKPASLAVTIDGRNISEVCDLSIGEAAQVPRRARAVRARPDDRRAGGQGGQRPARASCSTSASTTSRSSRSAGTLAGGEAQRIRLRQPDRQRPGRRALRARRAVDRPAPARQPAADRHAHPAARPRQHRDRRRARRGDDPRVADHVVDIGPGAGEHGGEVVYAGPVKGIAQGQGVDHRPVPRRASESIPVPDACAAQPGDEWLVDHGRPRAQPAATSTSRSRSAASSRSPACRGSGKRTLVNDILLPVADAEDLQVEDAARAAQDDRGHRAARQGHQHRPVADRAHAALEPGHLHRRVRQRSASCSPPRRRRRSAATCRAGSRST